MSLRGTKYFFGETIYSIRRKNICPARPKNIPIGKRIVPLETEYFFPENKVFPLGNDEIPTGD